MLNNKKLRFYNEDKQKTTKQRIATINTLFDL